jgi:hypothetical protein
MEDTPFPGMAKLVPNCGKEIGTKILTVENDPTQRRGHYGGKSAWVTFLMPARQRGLVDSIDTNTLLGAALP